MKKLSFFLFICCWQLPAFSQYWQQRIDYTIDVRLNDKEKTLDAFEKMVYQNNSPDTLNFIWFHLWPNAYKNDKTAFSDQLLENGNTAFYFSGKNQKGYINRLDFKADGITAKTEDHPQHIDIIKLVLPKPLPPGQKITITTPFHVKLPFNFSRGGYDGESFQITQWFPKPAVYDKNGWHPMPYLDQGEFYSEFGSFDVRITVPEKYIVAATGELQNEEETQFSKDKTQIPTPENKTLRYKQDKVHDFAWFADKRFIVKQDTCALPSGRVIQVSSYYTPAQQKLWKNSLQYAKDALRFYSNEIGEYPYNTATVVQGPESFGGGMEYPTITVISPLSTAKELDVVIAHELGHNWFYGILASNERDHPWMDEGLNTFYEQKYAAMKYGRQTQIPDLLYETKLDRRTAQSIESSSEEFTETNYFLAAYYGTAAAMRTVEKNLGKEEFKKRMQQYYEEWKFKHPQPQDLKKIFGITTRLDELLMQPRKGFKIISPLKKGSIRDYASDPVKNILLLSPAFGANRYDKLMVGGLISNYKLPPNSFQFFLAPMYGLGSKKFTGLGKLNYTVMPDGAIRKADFFLNVSKFSMDDFKDTAGRNLVMQFQKLVPGIKFTFREKTSTSTVEKFIRWKTFFIKEQSLRIIPDTLFNGTDTTLLLHYLLPQSNRYINQLSLVYKNSRGLYPFDVNLQIEQGKDFLRPTLTANYFFNYREGGLAVRLFAGKFIYIKEKTLSRQFANDRYFLNMTGPKGYEDYTYSDFFIGRNEWEGTASQQIMVRDGFFKVRTDLLASKTGKTDNWLTAANFNASLPENLNPLSVLPVKIPLHLFFDIGTYAEAWDRNAGVDRFLFDAGFHLPVLKEAVNIYIPIVYTKVYGDYFKSTIPKNRFFKTISFTIDFYTRDIQKINREAEF